MIGEPAVERGLARRILPVARLDDVPHDAFVDDRRIDARAPHGLAHDPGAELGGAQVLERAKELAGGRSHGGNDDGFSDVLMMMIRGHLPGRPSRYAAS